MQNTQKVMGKFGIDLNQERKNSLIEMHAEDYLTRKTQENM
jgi:hypothetical protein